MQIFNRGGFSRGYLRDMNDAELMCPERPNHMGALVGTRGVLRRDVDAEDALAERRGDAERPVKLQEPRRCARLPCAAIFTASWTRRRCARRGKAMPMSAA